MIQGQTFTYRAHGFGTVLSHFPTRLTLFRDGTDDAAAMAADEDELRAMARVRSGDYFATLATELDKVAQSLSSAAAPEAPDIERVVAELLYLDKHYIIKKKTSPER